MVDVKAIRTILRRWNNVNRDVNLKVGIKAYILNVTLYCVIWLVNGRDIGTM